MAAITIKNMDVTYNKGKSYVIKDMNLEIKDGEFCVFLGPSGCGKSTQCTALRVCSTRFTAKSVSGMKR